MRLASTSENFPYELATVCYLEIASDGSVTSPPEEGVATRVRSGESRLYAVWPGHYRSDLFLIDDIDEPEGVTTRVRSGKSLHLRARRLNLDRRPSAPFSR